MKKILNIFASISLVASGASTVVACGSKSEPIPGGEGCRETKILTSEQAQVNFLYNELNNNKKPYLIENDHFWGNEANYQQDFLKLFEKAASIPAQDDSLLSLASGPLQYYGKKQVGIDIGKGTEKEEAYVNIDWELTAAQKPIYQFYDKTWPELTSYPDGVSRLINMMYGGWDQTKKGPNWKSGDLLGWWKNNVGKSIPWDEKINNYIINFIKNSLRDLPSSITIHVDTPTTTTKKLAVGDTYEIPLSSIYLLSNGVKYPLGYYTNDSEEGALPKVQNWEISYNTYYNLMQNELAGDPVTWTLKKRDLNPFHPTQASNYWNSRYLARIVGSKYGLFTDDLSFTGTIKLDGTASKIEVWYKGVDQGFTIKFAVHVPSTAKQIINKIKTDHFLVPKDTNPNLNNAQTLTTIKKYLQKNNPKLSTSDLSYIYLDQTKVSEKLSPSLYSSIACIAVEGSLSASTTIYVKLSSV